MGVLRVLLAISVVLAHSAPVLGLSMVGGMIAVQSFYIISGFYMSMILNEKYIDKNGSYRLFISNRFLRLYPVYWAILLFSVLYSFFLHYSTGGANDGFLSSYFNEDLHLNFLSGCYLAFSNIFIFLQDLGLFLGIDPNTGSMFFTDKVFETEPKLYSYQFIRQGWTVGIELLYYLIAPFLVRRSTWVIIGLIIISLSARGICYYNGLDYDPWTYRFFPFELVFFLFGTVAYRIYRYLYKKEYSLVIPIFLLFLLVCFTLFYDKLNFPGQILIYYVLFFAAIPFIFILTKKSKYDREFGELSYPIYISHMLMVLVVDTVNIPYIGGYGGTILILTIGVSYFLNLLVAKPIERYRQKRVAA